MIGLSVFCLFTLVTWYKQVWSELKTATHIIQRHGKKRAYWCQLSNIIDVTGFLLVLFLLFVTGFQIHAIPLETLRVLAAFATCITLLRLIDWMRLFEDTSFYVMLIKQTIDDIKYFVLLLIIALLMFGVPVLMLDMNSAEGSELIDDNFHFWLLDLMFNQYMLALGEFGMDNFQDHPQQLLIYCFFFAATFISQLTMLNMLIAIMGDSFNRVFENRQINSVKMKIEFAEEYEAVLAGKA